MSPRDDFSSIKLTFTSLKWLMRRHSVPGCKATIALSALLYRSISLRLLRWKVTDFAVRCCLPILGWRWKVAGCHCCRYQAPVSKVCLQAETFNSNAEHVAV